MNSQTEVKTYKQELFPSGKYIMNDEYLVR